MTPKRIAQLEQMVERGTVSKKHIWEMLDAIKQRTWVGLTDEDKQTAVWTNGTFDARGSGLPMEDKRSNS